MGLKHLTAVLLVIISSVYAWNIDDGNHCTFDVPPVSEASTPLSPSYISLSIEFQFFPYFTGNFSDVNTFSLNLLKGLADVGDPLYIRIGGSTEDRVWYNASLPTAIVSQFHDWWESNPARGWMGPSFFDGIKLLPSDFKYVFGVNEGGFNDSSGHHSDAITNENIVRETQKAWSVIGDQLWAIEPGNEVSGFNVSYQGVWYRDPTQLWNLTAFVQENFNTTYNLLQGPILPGNPQVDQRKNPLGPLWRAGDLSGFKTGWTFDECWELGQNAYDRLREYSVHLYPATMCLTSLGEAVTIANTMLNHSLTAITLEPNRARAAYTAQQGVEFVVGECNSVSCSGKPGVSDSFSAALWSFDWALYAASIGVKRVYYHQGPGFPYAGIWPTEINGTEPSVRSAYYGYVLGSKAVGSPAQGTSGKRVVNLINSTTLSAYALYSSPSWCPGEWYSEYHCESSNCPQDSWKLTDLAFLNLREFNQSSPQGSRKNLTFEVGAEWNGAKVTRLTAPGADTLPITTGEAPWLESHDEEGLISVGCMTYTSGNAERVEGCVDEVVKNGMVAVMDSEAVLISKM